MSRSTWLIGTVIVFLSVTFDASGQVSDPPPPAPATPKAPPPGPAAEPANTGDRPVDLRDKPKGAEGPPERPRLNFPAGGFKGNDNRVPLPQLIDELKHQQQQQAAQNAAQQRARINHFNGMQQNQFGIQPPVYVPGYNPNQPYGYPGYVYPGYGYGYPGYGYVYPGYGYGYGYWNGAGIGVLRPGVVGGSTFFGNPHASQYFGNPHASQGK